MTETRGLILIALVVDHALGPEIIHEAIVGRTGIDLAQARAREVERFVGDALEAAARAAVSLEERSVEVGVDHETSRHLPLTAVRDGSGCPVPPTAFPPRKALITS